MNRVLLLIFIEFLICIQLLIAFLAAGVRKILRSLLTLTTIDKMSLSTLSIFKLASSDNLNAQFRKIVIMQ